MSPTERIVALEADVAKLQWQMAQLIARVDKMEGKRPEAVHGFKVVRTEAVTDPLFVNVDQYLNIDPRIKDAIGSQKGCPHE